MCGASARSPTDALRQRMLVRLTVNSLREGDGKLYKGGKGSLGHAPCVCLGEDNRKANQFRSLFFVFLGKRNLPR